MTINSSNSFGGFQAPPDELVNLFPIPLAILHSAMDYTKELEYMLNLPMAEDYYKKTSKDTFILDKPELESVRKFIQIKLNQYATHVMASTNPLKITQSWLNRSKKGQFHHEHSHPNSIVSGVWYPIFNDELPPIRFHNKNLPSIVLGAHKHNQYNSSTYQPSKLIRSGSLILFPSNVIHNVPPNNTDKERISLSFNTWADGDIGDINSLTYLPNN